MSQALIVSADPILNDIYAVNLNAYVATNVTIKDSVEEAIQLIDLNPNFDMVIALTRLNGEECAKRIFLHVMEKKVNLSVIAVGNDHDMPEGLIHILGKYDIKALIKAAATILEISAKDMADLSVPEHFPIPIGLFQHVEKSESDVFFRNKKGDSFEYIQIQEKGKTISIDFEKYQNEGVKYLFVPSEERLKFINQASNNIVGRLDEDISTQERADLVIDGMEMVADQISENEEVSAEVVKISTACIDSINQITKEVPKLKNLLDTLLKNKTRYIFLHGIVASYISNEIITNISWGGEGQAEKISFCLFFHDLFLVPIYDKYPELTDEEDLVYSDKLTEREKDLVLNHAKMAGELIHSFKKCPLGANTLITQHHGMTNGIGFASDFKDNISPLAKVMIISQDFVTELLKLPPEKWEDFDKDRAIRGLKTKYPRSSYLKIIEALEIARF